MTKKKTVGLKIHGMSTGPDWAIEPNHNPRITRLEKGSQMPTLRFGLHRPGVPVPEQNLNSVECEMVVEGGVARMNMQMVTREFNAELVVGYDGKKVIILLRDSEGNTENFHVYPKEEA